MAEGCLFSTHLELAVDHNPVGAKFEVLVLEGERAVDLQAFECLGALVKYNIRAGGYSDRRTSLRRTAAPAGGARPASTDFGADRGSRRVGRNRSCAMLLACFLFYLVLALASETPKTLPISEIGSTVAVSGPEVVVLRSGPTLDVRNRISTAPNSETENLMRFATPIPSCCSRRRAYCESFFKVGNSTRSYRHTGRRTLGLGPTALAGVVVF